MQKPDSAKPKPTLKTGPTKPVTSKPVVPKASPAPKSPHIGSSRPSKASSPWEYTPNTHSASPSLPAPSSSMSPLFLSPDATSLPDWTLCDSLLSSACQTSALFTRRLVQQRLSEHLSLLNPTEGLDSTRQTLEHVRRFLTDHPDFFLDTFGDGGFLAFPGLVRSEVFEVLRALVGRKAADLQAAAGYGPEELQKLLLELSESGKWVEGVTATVDSVEKAMG